MKTLILTCHTGDGHDSAARAIAREYEERGWEYVIADPIGIPTRRGSRFVCGFYNGMIRRTPRAFGIIYNGGHVFSKVHMSSPVYAMIRTNLRRLERFVREGNFDSVICTHVFGMEAMRGLRKHKGIRIPCFGVFTDYTTHPYTRTGMNAYFVPHRALEKNALAGGLKKEALVYTGIPVDKKFTEDISMEEARERLDMPAHKKIVMVMTGGVGCQTMADLAEKLAHAMDPADTELYVLCGRNQKLADKIRKACPDLPVHTVPFTKEVHYYMKASDVMLSKAGGLSTTEAAVARVPLVHLKTIPGCESRNAEFFSNMGLARAASSEKQAVSQVLSLLGDPDARASIRAAQQREINGHAARDIADFVGRSLSAQ
ncbi:MAG: hypothetical protein J6C26_10280 [Clostridia bacterium]|nr:hypothetical protein [Clostridia bacterium]